MNGVCPSKYSHRFIFKVFGSKRTGHDPLHRRRNVVYRSINNLKFGMVIYGHSLSHGFARALNTPLNRFHATTCLLDVNESLIKPNTVKRNQQMDDHWIG